MTDTEPALPFDPIAEARRHWRDHDWGADDAMAAVTSVMRAQQILIGRINAAIKPHGLTFARYEVLVLLTFSTRGSLPLGKIGERLQVHPASVTNAIDRLERAGYVQRRAHPQDGRAVLAEITAAGRRVVEAATHDLIAIRFGADGLADPDEVISVLAGLRASAGDFDTSPVAPDAR